MFVPKLVLEYFGVNAELVRNLQSDLAALRVERDLLRTELISVKVNNDWLRVQFNDLQRQNKALLEKAYDVRLPAAELQRAEPTLEEAFSKMRFSFEDVGDERAKELGLPVYE